MGRKRKSEYMLLSGSTELARGSQSAMKRQRRASVQYLSAAEQQALSIVPVRSQKRKHSSPPPEEVIDVEEEALKERTKRLRLTTAQDAAYEEASRLDRENEERERERERELEWNREWRREGRKPEHRAKVFAELFERKV